MAPEGDRLRVDLASVALAGSLRGDFQASESWKATSATRVTARRHGERPRPRPLVERPKRAAAKAQERIAKLEQAVKDAKAKAKADAKKADEEAKAA